MLNVALFPIGKLWNSPCACWRWLNKENFSLAYIYIYKHTHMYVRVPSHPPHRERGRGSKRERENFYSTTKHKIPSSAGKWIELNIIIPIETLLCQLKYVTLINTSTCFLSYADSRRKQGTWKGELLLEIWKDYYDQNKGYLFIIK